MKKIVFQLTIADIQYVANKELGREVSLEEIELIQNRIAEKISWYDAISESIGEMIVAANSES